MMLLNMVSFGRMLCSRKVEHRKFKSFTHFIKLLKSKKLMVARSSGLVTIVGLNTPIFAKVFSFIQCAHSTSRINADFSNSPSSLQPQQNRLDGSLFLIRCILCVFTSLAWFIKVLLRLSTLCILFSPLLLTYPFACLSDGFCEFWWSMAVWICRRSGPTIIKLGQWACTRRDIFSSDFCNRLSVLHTKTTHREWKFSQHIFNELFGKSNWKSFIISVQPDPIGSGCIAQVYKGVLDVKSFEEITGIQLAFAKTDRIDVAIKVAKKGVRECIELDLSILRSIASILQTFFPSLAYINPVACLDHFETLLERQVDLRNEAHAMIKFGKNFVNTNVRFPNVVCFSKDVIIETFENGININQLVSGTQKDPQFSTAFKKKVALVGVKALLKMVFIDNFVHGDLHPGNILVGIEDLSTHSNAKGKRFEKLYSELQRSVKSLFGTSDDVRLMIGSTCDQEIDPVLIMIDTGIAVEETAKNLKNLRLLFRAVIDKKGYDAGVLLLKYSPSHDCKNPEQFYADVEHLVQVARSTASLSKLNISDMLNELCKTVRLHKVSLDPSYVSVILAVTVLEGLGRSLHPDLDLFECARPYIFSIV